ncbi:MAG: phospholipase D-like domain-containing protein [Pseudomonadales bacterium]
MLLCSYIFDNDEVGRRFVGALAEAQARGVSVRVLVDAIGECYSWPRISRELRRAELPSRRFLPPRFVPPFGYVNLRTHRKLLIVDGAIGFCGGLNIGDRHVTDASGYRPVDDAHFRMEGPVVTDLRTLFSDDWRFAAGEDLPRVPVCAVAGDMLCRVVPGGPNEDMDKLLFILHGALASARRYVYIMTPYFLPERDLVAALQTTALRGVDVRVVVPYRSNLRYVDWAMQHMLPTLLRSGVRVFRRRKFSHAKLLTVDGRYSLVGSANLDPRSLRLNFEVGVEIFDEGFARELELLMEQEMAAPEDTVASLFARGRTRRLRDACMALFTPYL